MLTLLAGVLIGFTVAAIGAWKDSRWEPFRWRTFFRTPLVTIGCIGIILLFRPPYWLICALAAIALERLCIETWKGLFRRMPSKFQSKERDTSWLSQRLRLAFSPRQRLSSALVIAALILPIAITFADYSFAVANYNQLELRLLRMEITVGCPLGLAACSGMAVVERLRGHKGGAILSAYAAYGFLCYLGLSLAIYPYING